MGSPHSEAPMVEQIITEFFAKSLHAILASRYDSGSSRYSSSPSSSSSTSSIRSRDKWFNLALGECPAALENINLWGISDGNFSPLVVDVILLKIPNPNPHSGKIVERWTIQYQKRDPSEMTEMPSSKRRIYKQAIILLRSLYTTVRILPAFKIFQDLSSRLAHKISSFVEPFTRAEESEMENFVFSAVETPRGRLCLSVSYLPSLDELEPDSPLFPAKLIPDYVGSPLADPLRKFEASPFAICLPCRVSFTRRHSWSNSRRITISPPESPSPSSNSDADIHAVQRRISFGERKKSAPSSLPGRISSTSLVPSTKLTLTPQDLKVAFKWSSGSPRLTSSRFPAMDEFVSSGFFCPFVEDEDFRIDHAEPRNRHHSITAHQDSGNFQLARKSQGAVVGELIVLLKSAPPLQISASLPCGATPAKTGGAATSSSLLRSKTTFDALEELKSYREMKELLLGQHGAARRENPPLADQDSL